MPPSVRSKIVRLKLPYKQFSSKRVLLSNDALECAPRMSAYRSDVTHRVADIEPGQSIIDRSFE